MRALVVWIAVLLALNFAQCVRAEELPGDRMLANYFRAETTRLSDACLQGVDSLDEWNRRRPFLRQQLLEMLGLSPMPERTDLHATVTGVVQGPGFHVEKLHFQSLPGLYVTANLYLPEKPEGKLPAVLYVCGHAAVKENGVSYGNKVAYQHHGAWFARHGYACLVIDSLQLGEIEGMHHGLYRYDQWKWINYGYTPAGVEAWNCTRALDYLQSRPEVDPERIGVTGRSGGGAYSWWIAAIDDRIKAAVPVAGITDLEDHVVHGCVEGHCDCMYFSNTYGWDYATVAALVAPRPLLIANTDRDEIFPLDGVMRIHGKVRNIYSLQNAPEALGVAITTGGHVDSQEIQVPTFRWLNHALKNGNESLIDEPTRAYFKPEELRVFTELPSDARNARIQDEFIKPGFVPDPIGIPESVWPEVVEEWLAEVRSKCFSAWPGDELPLNVVRTGVWRHEGIRLETYDYDVHSELRLRLYAVRLDEDAFPPQVLIAVEDEEAWRIVLSELRVPFADALKDEPLVEPDASAWNDAARNLLKGGRPVVYCCPRGVGRTRWTDDPIARRHIERRFYLLGQTLDGMQVYDIRRAIQTVRSLYGPDDRALQDLGVPIEPRIELGSAGRMGVNTLYAMLFTGGDLSVGLSDVPASHDEGPYYLNVRKVWDIPQAVAAAGPSNVGVGNSFEADAYRTRLHDKWHADLPESRQQREAAEK